MKKTDLPQYLYSTMIVIGGKGSIIDICKSFWKEHRQELEQSGNLFYTWQYDIRWAATELRNQKKLKAANISPKGIWEIA